ncbi:hypothetical protein KM043_009260 [Ampulex compressa]|nr:hypothetical protein KM043_009260 [Ampulex compressa]
MAFGKHRARHRAYQVCVTILEAKCLPQNANPVVVVKVGNRKRKTMARERTDSPVYNEYFVFDFTCNLDELLGTRIMIAVYLRNCLKQLKFYASILFEVATVWDQPDHQYYHKWAMLMDPKDMAAGPKGYVKCNIAVNVTGEKVRVHPETEGEDDIEGNLLLPIGGEALPFRQRARYIFVVYRADGLPDMSSFCAKNDFENINPYIQISFSGMKLAMSVLIGFLPTFGPSFVHFYGSGAIGRNSCSGKCSTALPFYRGRVLLSVKTEMDDPEASPAVGVETEPAAPIIEKNLWKTEEYLLVAILYDVCLIDRGRFMTASISFEISLGNAGNHRFSRSQCSENDHAAEGRAAESRPDLESQTVPRTTGTLDGKYNYLPLGSRKPCVHVRSWWPNSEWRIYNSNSLSSIARFLEGKLEKLEALVAVENSEAYKIYNETIRALKSYCSRYLHILDTGRYDEEGGTTRLDRHRVNICRKEIESVLKRIAINGELPNNHYIRIAMAHAYQYLRKFQELCHDPQHSLPDVFIWMMAGSRRVACGRLSAQDVIYSEEGTQMGRKCGQRMNVFMRNPRDEGETIDYSACKIELFLWLGNAKFATACWSAVPAGYEVDHQTNIDSFPRHFEYTQSSAFQLRAHIFQGRFDPGMDASGLLDPVVRVAFHGYTLETRVIRQTLDPFWDQSLIFPPVTIHGTQEHIKRHPPEVVLQVFDQDVCVSKPVPRTFLELPITSFPNPGLQGTKEFCGRCIAVPSVKLAVETYSPPDFPPKLEWYKFKSQRDCSGSVLAAFELLEAMEKEAVDLPMDPTMQEKIYNIPADIRPKMASYRLEVVFWGVRDMRKINYVPVHKPRIIIECAGVHVKSEVMENAKKYCNFEEPHVMVDLDMPELDIYYPSVTIKAYDSRGFGCFKYAGICIIPSVYVFLERLITEEEYEARVNQTKPRSNSSRRSAARVLPLPQDYDPSGEESRVLIAYEKLEGKEAGLWKILEASRRLLRSGWPERREETKIYEGDDDETLDWWSKYCASLEEERNKELGLASSRGEASKRSIVTFEPQFEGFQDRLGTFELWRGKKTGGHDQAADNYVGKFKGHISIYRWPHPEKLACKTRSGRNAANGLCADYPPQEPVKLLVRLYVVKGINLHPNDPLSGKSDPYLCVKLGKNTISDRKNYVPNQLNPTFGKVFEIEAMLPQDYMLVVQVWDYDSTSSDDLIGETRIDVENRFYSGHRACCGISRSYDVAGYNAWRDRERPTRILEALCRRNGLSKPEYGDRDVRIGKRRFQFSSFVDRDDEADREERMALNVLHQWQDFPICGCALVPEHVERRPLFNIRKPGLEQGKLELWVDMFQFGQLPPKPAVDIRPQAPEEYEIRVIVWNTEDVPLVESQFLTGEKCSDIYVKGWILYEDYQRTDIHYSSLNGEGNFNWRFVFRVTYSKSEHAMVVRKKMSILARSATEERLPCRLNLQVWDSDHFSSDDFLGSLTLDLSRMQRGSGSAKNCSLNLLDPQARPMNLFKASRTRGWWPFLRGTAAGKYVQAGKVELEMSVLPASEADERPAGRGRDPPESLPPPSRPDTSFSWFRNPWKAFCYVLCRHYKWRMILCLLSVLLVLLIACGVYAFPGYFVKRLLGA